MVIKVRDPKRWQAVPADNCIPLMGEGRRPVRLEVNAVSDASFMVRYPDDSFAFLAAFQGMEIIEFIADGPVEVWVTSEAEVFCYTDDGGSVAFVNEGKVSFAKPHERRGDKDQIIYMQELMLANERRRNAKLEYARAALEAREAEANANSGGATEGTVPDGEGTPPVDASADGGTEGVDGEQPAGTEGGAAVTG